MKCPESIEELHEIENMLPLCKIELYNQAKARIETGAAKSVSEASRQLGEETGRNPETIRRRIQEGQLCEDAQLAELSGTDKHRPANEQFRTSFTGDNEWYTPVEYIKAAREVMGTIDLDPATSAFGQARIGAANYRTLENDGLSIFWSGNVWLNPPYSQPDISNFIKKAVAEWNAGNINQAINLTNNFTDTTWFHLAESAAALICFTKGRIRFEKPNGPMPGPTQGSVFFYFGSNKNKFREIFGEFGFIR